MCVYDMLVEQQTELQTREKCTKHFQGEAKWFLVHALQLGH